MEKLLYLAGPITGYPDHNFPAFQEAADRLRGLGHEVVSPAECGGIPQESMSWTDWMRRDLILLISCDRIAVLPGWENSKGASLEVHVGRSLGFQILDAITLEPISDSVAPSAFSEIERLFGEVEEWRAETFPNSDLRTTLLHFKEEVLELLQNPYDAGEIADVAILLLGICQLTGVDLKTAIRSKHEINKNRTWGEPDQDGVVRHVGEVTHV